MRQIVVYVLTAKLGVRFKDLIATQWDHVQSIALHDWFCYAFARSHGFEWYIDPLSGMLYRQHSSNHFGVNQGVAATKSRLLRVFDGWWLQQVELTALLLEKDHSDQNKHANPDWNRGSFWPLLKPYECRRKWRDKMVFPLIYFLAKLAK